MPEVIANTSPIQYLFQLGLLDLLPDFYGQITIPQAVSEEIDRGGCWVSTTDLSTLSWAYIAAPRNLLLFPLANGLGRGELEVIALAKEIPDHLALLDDRRARRFADLVTLAHRVGQSGKFLKRPNRYPVVHGVGLWPGINDPQVIQVQAVYGRVL